MTITWAQGRGERELVVNSCFHNYQSWSISTFVFVSFVFNVYLFVLGFILIRQIHFFGKDKSKN